MAKWKLPKTDRKIYDESHPINPLLQLPVTSDPISDSRIMMQLNTRKHPDCKDESATYTKGKFSYFEQAQVDLAVKEYLEESNLLPDDVFRLVLPLSDDFKKQHKGFHAFVHARSGLNRSRDQVLHFVTRFPFLI